MALFPFLSSPAADATKVAERFRALKAECDAAREERLKPIPPVAESPAEVAYEAQVRNQVEQCRNVLTIAASLIRRRVAMNAPLGDRELERVARHSADAVALSSAPDVSIVQPVPPSTSTGRRR